MLGAFGVIAMSLACLQLIELFEASEIQGAIELIQKNALVSVRLVGRVAMDVEHDAGADRAAHRRARPPGDAQHRTRRRSSPQGLRRHGTRVLAARDVFR